MKPPKLPEPRLRTAWLFAAIALLVFLARLCHSGVIWVEEGYPLAAANEMARGKMLYRDFWFDKPPLFPLFYSWWGAPTGWLLRLAGTLYVLFASACAFFLARRFWSNREGRFAAALLAFYLTFGIHAAVLVVGPDMLTIAPHLLAILFCLRAEPLRAGAASGLALLANPKAAFVLASCLLWQWRRVHWLALGAGAVQTLGVVWLAANGALDAYWQQVWDWGFLYSAQPLPDAHGLRRTLNWAGFHAPLILGTLWLWWKERGRETPRQILWVLLSLAAVAAGWRFFPRYYFHLLTPMVILGARGLVAMPFRLRAAVLLLLLIPTVRFGPRYIQVALNQPWSDLALFDDSRDVANRIKGAQSMLLWGYRPEIYPLSQVPAATPWLDSQPLTGVIADRHLTDSTPAAPDLAKANRLKLVAYEPEVIVDGLGVLNPQLAISQYQELNEWLSRYRIAERTRFSIIYRRAR